VRVKCGGAWKSEKATLVLSKRGLDRLEREGDASTNSLDLF